MPTTTSDALSLVGQVVVIAPLVLLSAADHYHRSAKGTRRRVVGCLLGSKEGNRVRVTNSFAIPFEEDERDSAVFFADHTYIENFAEMARKVNARG
jgi:26S proteasome regulatory subunit N8